ncbi:glycosyl transferase [Nocardioides gansuensis]|uniref:Glycosyl transferase n=1 Tax=Nocardioides gansuensis TaxID=2138300 RepID=A0A2T8F9R0_9ACTN|nr:glycosyltransferase [Nocardioides gansuensis]PVG82430.1 glycosyl transferase [Nocardioides gansuensis]
MRIALVSEHASPLATLGGADAGGQNVHVAALARELAGHGHDVTVFTRRDSTTLPDEVAVEESGVRYLVRHVSAGPPDEVPKDDLWPHMSAFAAELALSLQDGPYDIVHSHFWMSGWATLRAVRGTRSLLGLPVVHTFHALGVVKRRHQGDADTSPPGRLEVERDIGLGVDRVIATATDEVRELEAQGIGADRCTVVPCGVDVRHFRPDVAPAAEPPRTATHRVLVLGRMVERKGIADAVTALQWLPDTELVIAGGPRADVLHLDPEASRLRGVAAEAGVAERVRFLGSVNHEDVPGVIRAADVVCSVPWYEPFGIVPVEAMACGRPVVGTAVGGLLDTVVPGVTGELVPPRDPRVLSGALRDLLADPGLRAAYGADGVRRARERFSWPQVAERTLQVYDEVIGLATPGRGREQGAVR